MVESIYDACALPVNTHLFIGKTVTALSGSFLIIFKNNIKHSKFYDLDIV